MPFPASITLRSAHLGDQQVLCAAHRNFVQQPAARALGARQHPVRACGVCLQHRAGPLDAPWVLVGGQGLTIVVAGPVGQAGRTYMSMSICILNKVYLQRDPHRQQ
jgi:hypothetical protein